jgi:uroporphyrinogen decarboxylase
MMVNPGIVQAILEKILDVNIQYWELALASVGKNVLVVSMADDLAAQNSLLVDLETYKK